MGFRKHVYVFDLDGVLIDVRERIRKVMEALGIDSIEDPRRLRGRRRRRFWELFLSPRYLSYDRPREIGLRLLRERLEAGGSVVIVTGRPQRLKEYTVRELLSIGVPVDALRIYFRREGDRRKDYEYKAGIISRIPRVREVHEDSVEVLDVIARLKPEATLYLHYDEYYVVYRRGSQA